jgi:hypothetical protein
MRRGNRKCIPISLSSYIFATKPDLYNEEGEIWAFSRRRLKVVGQLALFHRCVCSSDALSVYIEWEHEREWRIIRNFNDAAKKVGPDPYGKDVLLFAIPPDCIRSIVLSYRARPEAASRVREITSRDSALSHVLFERAAMNAEGQIEMVPDDMSARWANGNCQV